MLDQLINAANTAYNVVSNLSTAKSISDHIGLTDVVNKMLESAEPTDPHTQVAKPNPSVEINQIKNSQLPKGLYFLDGLNPNNIKIIDIISNATSLSYSNIKERIENNPDQLWLIGRPIHCSNRFVEDLKNAGANIYWDNVSPCFMERLLARHNFLYYGDLNPPE